MQAGTGRVKARHRHVGRHRLGEGIGMQAGTGRVKARHRHAGRHRLGEGQAGSFNLVVH